MSFYVTLHNKETNFETIIDPPMVNLNNYEVALFDIKFTSDFLIWELLQYVHPQTIN